MENVDPANLVYLVLLGTCVAGWFIAENRQSMGRNARQLMAWGLIFLGFLAAYGLWEDISMDLSPRQSVAEDGSTIIAPRRPDGHFHLTVDVNGKPVDFLVDTGATEIVLTLEDARRVGIDPDDLAFLGTARTANGDVRTARAFAESLSLGPLTFEGVPLSVNGGEMAGSLLGMTFLSRFDRLEIAGDRLILEP